MWKNNKVYVYVHRLKQIESCVELNFKHRHRIIQSYRCIFSYRFFFESNDRNILNFFFLGPGFSFILLIMRGKSVSLSFLYIIRICLFSSFENVLINSTLFYLLLQLLWILELPLLPPLSTIFFKSSVLRIFSRISIIM